MHVEKNVENQCVNKEDMTRAMTTMKEDVTERLQFQFHFVQNATTSIMFSLQIDRGKMHTQTNMLSHVILNTMEQGIYTVNKI